MVYEDPARLPRRQTPGVRVRQNNPPKRDQGQLGQLVISRVCPSRSSAHEPGALLADPKCRVCFVGLARLATREEELMWMTRRASARRAGAKKC